MISMNRLQGFGLMVAFVCLLSACAQEAPLPTLAATTVPETPTDNQTAGDNAQPTAVTEPTATATQVTIRRPTLPPTWTPVLRPTETPLPTQSIPTATPFVPRSTLPEACSTFAIDFENSTREFPVGMSPRAAWTPVEGAQAYRVRLLRTDGFVIRDDIYIEETSYVFDGRLFEEGQRYGWSVYPINSAGDQMCFERGQELVPYVPIG